MCGVKVDVAFVTDLVLRLQANKMSLQQAPVDGDPLTFTLIDKTPGSDLRIVIQAPSDDVKQNWVTQIRSILDMQGDFLKGWWGRGGANQS